MPNSFLHQPILSKKKTEAIANGAFLICLGILFATDAWWPGILLAIWVSLAVRQYFSGRLYDLMMSSFILLGLFVISLLKLDWSILMPVLFVVGGIYIIFREISLPKIPMGKTNHRKYLMTSTMTEKPPNAKLIHAASIFVDDGRNRFLFLRRKTPPTFAGIGSGDGVENETAVSAPTIEEALRLAARHFKRYFFRTLICGFRYTLPEHDEHGINALFHRMAASCSSMNGVYYDEELGDDCFVQNASNEAYQLWQRLKAQQRL